LHAVCTLAAVDPFSIAVRTPSYAATVSDCFKNNAEHDSSVAMTMSTTTGKHTASSAAATPRRLLDRFDRRMIHMTFVSRNPPQRTMSSIGW
jgi:hypothetical protein